LNLLCTLGLPVVMHFPRRNPIQLPLILCPALLFPAAAAAQQPALQAKTALATAPQFEIAAIHLHESLPHEHNSISSSPSDGHFRAENISVLMLIQWAYNIPDTRILDVPGWAKSTFFNIDAEADEAIDQQLHNLSSDAGRKVKEQMVQALLADRFKLVTHAETRELPIYALVVAKGGAKLGEIQDIKSGGTSINSWKDHLDVQGTNSLALLAQVLADDLGRPVVDRTGIAGRYHLTLKWTPDDATSASPANSNAPPSIFTALQEQLGLKLQSQKGPVQVLVVDHVEMPSAN
jgi:uncharacterized protein (TIGR03435 family)